MRNGKILCAHDLTPTSASALALALDLGRRLGVGVCVLHVAAAPYPPRPLFAAPTVEDLEIATGVPVREEVAALARLQDELATWDGGSQAETEVRHGVPADVVAEVARELGASLVVVGMRARSTRQALLGSVSESIVRSSPCPVVVARTDGAGAAGGA